MSTRDLLQLATNYHKALPGRLRRYLNERGIPDLLIDFHLLGWNGHRITIPIFNRAGELVFFKLARDPDDTLPGPKMLATPGAYAELYGWDAVLKKPSQIVICEGEFDRLVLEAHGFFAVTSTGGAGVFRREWAKDLEAIRNVYVCFDNDEAGHRGATHVCELIPHAKLVELPAEVGQGGDVTDFFVRLGRRSEDFLALMEQAMPLPPSPPPHSVPPRMQGSDPEMRARIDRVKSAVPIARVIERYVKLHAVGDRLIGLCPFHEDHNPSLVVFPATGTFHCFGCAKHGDMITFVRKIESLSFHEALEWLEGSGGRHSSQAS